MEEQAEELLKIGNQTLVVAGMATMPSRLESFELAINSILPQVDRLFLFLDRFETPYVSADPRVVVLTSDIFGDLRANGKLMGLSMAGPDAYYFCVDDDIIYPPDYVRTMLGYLSEHDNSAVAAVHSSILKPDLTNYVKDRFIYHRSGKLDRATEVHVAGTCTTAFHTGILEFDVREWETTNKVDLNFALECSRRRIAIHSIPRERGWIKCIDEHQPDSIYAGLRNNDTVQTELAKRLLREFNRDRTTAG